MGIRISACRACGHSWLGGQTACPSCNSLDVATRESESISPAPPPQNPDVASIGSARKTRKLAYGAGIAAALVALVGVGLAVMAWLRSPQYAAERYLDLVNAGRTSEALSLLDPPVALHLGDAGLERLYRAGSSASSIESIEVVGDKAVAIRHFAEAVTGEGQSSSEPSRGELGSTLILRRRAAGWLIIDCAALVFSGAVEHGQSHFEKALAAASLLREAACASEGLDQLEAAVLASIGNAAYNQGAYEKATEALQRSLSLHPTGEAHYQLGYVFRDNKALTNNLERAVAEFRAAVQLEPNNGGFHSALADVYRQSGNFDGAILSFERALELTPADVETRYFYALALLQKNRYKDGKAQIEEVIRMDPDYRNAGELLRAVKAQLAQQARVASFRRQLREYYGD